MTTLEAKEIVKRKYPGKKISPEYFECKGLYYGAVDAPENFGFPNYGQQVFVIDSVTGELKEISATDEFIALKENDAFENHHSW